jgi:SAM-dependent methyltransferase
MTSTEHWSDKNESRNDFRIANDYIRSQFPSGMVLDVGCFNGSFLASLGLPYKLNGIEINGAAAAVAESRGVKIIGRDLDDLKSISDKYDIVTALDVIEHVVDPLRFIGLLKDVLKPGGIIIISSGNTEALSWKIMGSRYVYCSISEHVAFINKNWCEGTAVKLGLKCDKICYFSHDATSMGRLFLDIIKNFLYLVAPNLVAKLRTFGRVRRDGIGKRVNPPPPWGSARNHLMVQFSLPVEKYEKASSTNHSLT